MCRVPGPHQDLDTVDHAVRDIFCADPTKDLDDLYDALQELFSTHHADHIGHLTWRRTDRGNVPGGGGRGT